MHAENRMFSKLNALFAYNFLMVRFVKFLYVYS